MTILTLRSNVLIYIRALINLNIYKPMLKYPINNNIQCAISYAIKDPLLSALLMQYDYDEKFFYIPDDKLMNKLLHELSEKETVFRHNI